jgi:hypothetical protein
MKPALISLVFVGLASAVCAQTPAQDTPAAQAPAQDPPKTQAPAQETPWKTKTPPPGREDPKYPGYPFRKIPGNIQPGKILKVDLEKHLLTLSIVGEDGAAGVRNFVLDDRTVVFTQGKSLTVKELKPGTDVKVQFIPKEGEAAVANRIRVQPTAPPDIHAQKKPSGTGN